MTKDIKEQVKEILDIVKLCPDPLKEKCFELLLLDTLSKTHKTQNIANQEKNLNTETNGDLPLSMGNSDVEKRVKVFATAQKIQLNQIQNVFGFDDNGEVTIEVTDLKTSKNSQKQKKLALLIGVRHQFIGGSFDVPVEELREMCVTYGCYDPANFGANMKNSNSIFAGYKSSGINKLSPLGKEEAGKLIAEIGN